MQVVEDGVEARLTSLWGMRHVVSRLIGAPEPRKLTRRLYEVLAIVAVLGEIPHSAVRDARGVDSHEALSELVDRGYLESRDAGEISGRPWLYRLTARAVREMGATTIEGMRAQWEAIRDAEGEV